MYKRQVLNLFYQAFDKGELADGEGRLIDCKNILFMLTSNCGFDAANDQFAVKSDEELRRSLLTFFKPALLARMQIVQYLSLIHISLVGNPFIDISALQ